MFRDTYESLKSAKIDDHLKMDAFIDTFAPIPAPKQDDKWVELVLELVTMGGIAGFGSIVKSGTFNTRPLSQAFY